MPTVRRTTRKPRATRTKADIENELEELKSTIENAEELDPQAEVLAKEHATKTRETVKGLSVDTIVANGAKFGLEAQRTVASLTEQCVAKANELKALQDAVEFESAELQRLYDLDTASSSIQILIQEHEQKKTDLEVEITAARKAWQEEQNAHAKAIAQRNADTEQARRRDQEAYDYRVAQDRAKVRDEAEQGKIAVQRTMNEMVESTNKDLAERKAIIAKEEAEFNAFKARVGGLDEEISKASAREVAIATNSLKKDLTQQHTLEMKELQTQLRLSEQNLSSEQKTSEKLAVQIEVLTKQLDAARQQVIEVSNKALESAGGQAALASMREVILNKDNGAASRGSKS